MKKPENEVTVQPIESKHNTQLKQLRKLHRRRTRNLTGNFFAEGEDLLAVADSAGWQPIERYCSKGSGLPGQEVVPELLADVSTLGSGTRTLAVYQQRWQQPSGPLCVYLHGVKDPGNVGTVLRSARAFGASTVALGPECADPYGPKAVRASMGALFEVPLAKVENLNELPGELIALAPSGEEPLAGSYSQPVTLLAGAEREGLSQEIVGKCDRSVRIPVEYESLNVAMAVTVALYELQRSAGKTSRMTAK